MHLKNNFFLHKKCFEQYICCEMFAFFCLTLVSHILHCCPPPHRKKKKIPPLISYLRHGKRITNFWRRWNFCCSILNFYRWYLQNIHAIYMQLSVYNFVAIHWVIFTYLRYHILDLTLKIFRGFFKYKIYVSVWSFSR